MSSAGISIGLQLGTQPPLSATRAFLLGARAMRLDSVMLIDHFQKVFPSAIWDQELTWLAARRPTPHEFFDYQVLLGYLASRVERMRLGVGVTESIRRHPVLIARAMMTLSHLTKRAPILGIGAGERMNIDPYRLDFAHPVTRLEEALQIVRLCLSVRGPITFCSKYFRLDRATVDLKPATGRVPEIWIAGHGPRMLALTGRYGDGWYPTAVVSPHEYADKLATVRTAARAAGRNPAAVTPALHRFMVIAATEREARAPRGPRSRVGSGLQIRGRLRTLGHRSGGAVTSGVRIPQRLGQAPSPTLPADHNATSVDAGAAAKADLQDAAGDDPGVGDQVDHSTADILGLQPGQRYRVGFHHAAHQIVGNVVTSSRLHHRCLGGCRADDVDRDAFFGDLQRHRLGQSDDTPFGGVVCGEFGDAHSPAHRGCHHDPAVALAPHHRNGRPQSMKRAFQIGVHQLLPHLIADFIQRPGADDAGIGHRDVQAAQVVERLLHRGANLVGVANVEGDRQAPPAQLFDSLGRVVQLLLGAKRIAQVRHRRGHIADDDVRPFGRQGQGVCTPLPSSPAGDEGHASIQGTHSRLG